MYGASNSSEFLRDCRSCGGVCRRVSWWRGDGSSLHLPGVNLVMTGNATLNAGSVTGTGARYTNFGSLTGNFDRTIAGTK